MARVNVYRKERRVLWSYSSAVYGAMQFGIEKSVNKGREETGEVETLFTTELPTDIIRNLGTFTYDGEDYVIDIEVFNATTQEYDVYVRGGELIEDEKTAQSHIKALQERVKDLQSDNKRLRQELCEARADNERGVWKRLFRK